MTTKRDLKKLIRERMKKTGESYSSARRALLAEPPTPRNANPPKIEYRSTADMSPLDQVCERLCRDSNALSIVLLDADGKQLGAAGDAALLDANDAASLLSASGKAISELVADREFTGQVHRADSNHVHVSAISQRALLAVLFDNSSSLGLVRLRVKKATEELARLLARDTPGSGGSPPATPPAGSSGSPAPAQVGDQDEPLH